MLSEVGVSNSRFAYRHSPLVLKIIFRIVSIFFNHLPCSSGLYFRIFNKAITINSSYKEVGIVTEVGKEVLLFLFFFIESNLTIIFFLTSNCFFLEFKRVRVIILFFEVKIIRTKFVLIHSIKKLFRPFWRNTRRIAGIAR